MKSNFRFMFPNHADGIGGQADYERDILTLEMPSGEMEFSLSHVRHVLDKPYHINKPDGGWKKKFTEAEKRKLRPMAETLAMLDGNAFFGMNSGECEHYESYLAEAHAVYEANGGDNGWAGEASFARPT